MVSATPDLVSSGQSISIKRQAKRGHKSNSNLSISLCRATRRKTVRFLTKERLAKVVRSLKTGERRVKFLTKKKTTTIMVESCNLRLTTIQNRVPTISGSKMPMKSQQMASNNFCSQPLNILIKSKLTCWILLEFRS